MIGSGFLWQQGDSRRQQQSACTADPVISCSEVCSGGRLCWDSPHEVRTSCDANPEALLICTRMKIALRGFTLVKGQSDWDIRAKI